MENENFSFDKAEELPPSKKSGGLYKNVNVSVKTVNYVIVAAIAALFISIVILTRFNGFKVSFDTNGGKHIEEVKVMHGETLPEIDTPVKEGYTFTGWYLDRGTTYKWNENTDTVTESITLYAGWEEK